MEREGKAGHGVVHGGQGAVVERGAMATEGLGAGWCKGVRSSGGV